MRRGGMGVPILAPPPAGRGRLGVPTPGAALGTSCAAATWPATSSA